MQPRDPCLPCRGNPATWGYPGQSYGQNSETGLREMGDPREARGQQWCLPEGQLPQCRGCSQNVSSCCAPPSPSTASPPVPQPWHSPDRPAFQRWSWNSEDASAEAKAGGSCLVPGEIGERRRVPSVLPSGAGTEGPTCTPRNDIQDRRQGDSGWHHQPVCDSRV